MKKGLLTAASAATLCIAAGGAFADQPVNKEGPARQDQWDDQQYITVCSNNGRGNNNETVSTGLPPAGCLKFVPGDSDNEPNNDTGVECINTEDCDPKPAD